MSEMHGSWGASISDAIQQAKQEAQRASKAARQARADKMAAISQPVYVPPSDAREAEWPRWKVRIRGPNHAYRFQILKPNSQGKEAYRRRPFSTSYRDILGTVGGGTWLSEHDLELLGHSPDERVGFGDERLRFRPQRRPRLDLTSVLRESYVFRAPSADTAVKRGFKLLGVNYTSAHNLDLEQLDPPTTVSPEDLAHAVRPGWNPVEVVDGAPDFGDVEGPD